MSQSDDTLMEFTRFYEQCKNSIFNYILYRVSFDRDTAEDLTSEIFLKAFQAFDRYDRARPFKTWIFTIAHNHLVNFYSSRRTHISIEDAFGLKDESQHIPEDTETKLLLQKILPLVKKLPESQQCLILMRYVEDLSNSEIAEVLGKDEGAVRTGISRAISTLRQLYQNYLSKQAHETP